MNRSAVPLNTLRHLWPSPNVMAPFVKRILDFQTELGGDINFKRAATKRPYRCRRQICTGYCQLLGRSK